MTTFHLRRFLQHFLPGLPARAVESRVKAGILPLEISPTGEVVATPRVLTCLTVCLPLLGRASRGLAVLSMWQRCENALSEGEQRRMKAYLVMEQRSGWSGCFLSPDAAAPVPPEGSRCIHLSTIEARWKEALARVEKVEDLAPEKEQLLALDQPVLA